ncbi:MAG: insulinase family protein [Dehalococcoidia bacterium]|nr:insulinase family protein [Dehalococcoidia bacterium]
MAPQLPSGTAGLISKRQTEQAQLCLASPGLSNRHPDRFVLDVLDAVLGDGMGSRLISELREKRGLAYQVSSQVTDYADTGSVSTCRNRKEVYIDSPRLNASRLAEKREFEGCFAGNPGIRPIEFLGLCRGWKEAEISLFGGRPLRPVVPCMAQDWPRGGPGTQSASAIISTGAALAPQVGFHDRGLCHRSTIGFRRLLCRIRHSLPDASVSD